MWFNSTKSAFGKSRQPTRHYREDGGAVSVIAVLILGLWLAFAFGVGRLIWDWNQIARLQIELDQCVGEEAMKVKDLLTEIDSANDRIQALRAAISAAVEAPAVAAALQATLKAVVFAQDLLVVKWKAMGLQWLTQTCSHTLSSSEKRNPMPDFNWKRVPPDMIGENTLRSTSSVPDFFSIWVTHKPRQGLAYVSHQNKKWNPSWKNPKLALRASTR